MNGIVVICSYRPKPGKEKELLELVGTHVPKLRGLGLATGHARSVMRSEDGVIVEVFEWASREASEAAHDHPEVKKMWDRFAELCDFVPLSSLKETQKPFAHFKRPVPKRPNRVVHFEIPADQPERCGKFYSDVFGWKVSRWGEAPYWLVDTGEEPQPGIDGGIMPREEPAESVCNTIGVADLDQHCKLVEKHGGKIVRPKTPIPGVGWFAYGTDSEGNRFGMMQSDPTAR